MVFCCYSLSLHMLIHYLNVLHIVSCWADTAFSLIVAQGPIVSPKSPPPPTFYLAMPSTRPTTRMQRRAEPFAPRRRNARENATAPSEENRPATLSAATVASQSSQVLSAAVIQDIASAVSSAVVASLRSTARGPSLKFTARGPSKRSTARDI